MITTKRREFIQRITLVILASIGYPLLAANADWAKTQLKYFKGQDVLARILQKSSAEKWRKMPIGEVIGKVALTMKGSVLGIQYFSFVLSRNLLHALFSSVFKSLSSPFQIFKRSSNNYLIPRTLSLIDPFTRRRRQICQWTELAGFGILLAWRKNQLMKRGVRRAGTLCQLNVAMTITA